MPTSGSVSHWIGQLQSQHSQAAQQLWSRYVDRLVHLAGQKLKQLRTPPLGLAGEEDVALDAFASFCRAARKGRFPQLSDRNDLWQLLLVITERKAIDLVQHETRQKRGGGKVHAESAVFAAPGPSQEKGLDSFSGREPTPEFAAQAAEELERLLDSLGDDQLRSIAQWKMAGFTNAEIAGKLGCVTSTVERRLRLIRMIWKEEQ